MFKIYRDHYSFFDLSFSLGDFEFAKETDERNNWYRMSQLPNRRRFKKKSKK